MTDSSPQPKRVSAEQARHVVTETDRPSRVHAADSAFIHSMHVGAVGITAAGLLGAVVLVSALRPAAKSAESVPAPEHVREGGR